MEAKTEKRFDCIAFKRQVQQEIDEQTKGMSDEQLIEYFDHAAESGPLADLWNRIRKQQHQGP